MPDAPAQPFVPKRARVPAGEVSQHRMPDGPLRTTWTYRSAGVRAGSTTPLLVVLDGEVWTGPQDLPTTLDNMVADGLVPPVVAVLPSSGGAAQRWVDMGADGSAADDVARTVVPWARRHLDVPAGPVVVAGQSLGGLTALRCALTHPAVVDVAVSLSASLWQDDLTSILDTATTGADGPRIYLAHGNQEWVLHRPHLRLADRLRAAGMEVGVDVVDGGHDYAWWRGSVADGLVWALRPPPGRRTT